MWRGIWKGRLALVYPLLLLATFYFTHYCLAINVTWHGLWPHLRQDVFHYPLHQVVLLNLSLLVLGGVSIHLDHTDQQTHTDQEGTHDGRTFWNRTSTATTPHAVVQYLALVSSVWSPFIAYIQAHTPVYTRHWTNVGLVLGQRRRRWANTNSTLVQLFVFVGTLLYKNHDQLSKRKTFIWHLYNVGPTSKTSGRRCTNIIQMFCVYWKHLTDVSPAMSILLYKPAEFSILALGWYSSRKSISSFWYLFCSVFPFNSLFIILSRDSNISFL